MAAGNEERISSYIDLASTGKETDAFVKRLNEVYDLYKKINATKITLEGSKSFAEVAASVKKLKTEEEELQKISNQVEATYKKRMALESQQAKILAEEKELLRQRNLELKNQVREENAVGGSIEELRAKLIRLNKAYDNLGRAERESLNGQTLKKDINSVITELKELEGSTGRFQRNVGNYANAFAQALSPIDSGLTDIKNKINSGVFSDKEITQFKNQEQLLLQVTQSLTKEFGSTKQQARAFQEAAQQIGVAFGQNSEIFQHFRKQVGEGVDALNDIKDSIKNAASDTGKLDLLVGAANGIVGGFTAAAGAAELFDGDNKELQKSLVKLNALMAILSGLQQVQNELRNKDSILRKAANYLTTLQTKLTQQQTAAQQISNTATETGTKVTKGFSAALKSIGIGLLLTLIPVVVSAMSAFSKETENTAEKAKLLRDITGEGTKALQNERVELSALLIVARDETKSKDERLQAIQAINAKMPEYNNNINLENINSEKVNKQIQAYLENIQKKAKAQAYVSKIQELYTQLIDAENTAIGDNVKWYQILLNAVTTGGNAADGLSKNLQSSVKNRQEDTKALKDQIDVLNTSFANELKNGTVILDLSTKTASTSVANTKKVTAGTKEQAKEVLKSIQLLTLSQSKIAEVIAARKQAEEDEALKRIEQINITLSARQSQLTEQSNAELKILTEQYINGEIKTEAYEKAKLAITEKYARLNIEAQLKANDELLSDPNISPEKRTELEAKQTELKAQYYELDAQNYAKAQEDKTKADEERVNKLGRLLDNIKQVTDAIADTIEAVLTGGIERQKNQVQQQIDDIEKQKEAEIAAANATATSQEEKANRIAIINATAQAKKEALERRQRQLDEQKAKTERVFQVFSIIGNTAIAVTKFLAQGNVAGAVIAGIIGAAQLAQVLVTPIPKYKDGREDGKAELAIVGDGGRSEVVELATGKAYKTPATDTLTYLPEGARVYPSVAHYVDEYSQRTHLPQFSNQMISDPQTIAIRELQVNMSDMSDKLSSIEKAIVNKPVAHVTNTWGGVQVQMQQHLSWMKWVNKYF